MNVRWRQAVTDAAQGGSGGMPTENCCGQSNVLGTRLLNKLLNTATVSLPKGICNKINSETGQDIVRYERPYERYVMEELNTSVTVCDLQRPE